jgi:phosphoesterase RecJ-like protein
VEKYGEELLFLVGDGNHSLATAKACRDESNPLSKYALVEIVNIYDEGLKFEPIHRAIFGVDNAKFIVEIDHHKNDNTIADLCLNDDTAAATAILVYNIMRAANMNIDSIASDLLALGILTDTGNFKFVRNGDALRIMADLIDSGVNVRNLIEMMNNKQRKAVQLEAQTAANAEFFYNGRLALATVSKKDYKYLDGRGELVLNLLGQIKGVEYIVLLKEQKPEQTGVSIRSRRKPIDGIAVALGGGGHERAAGAIVRDNMENVRKRILELFKEE